MNNKINIPKPCSENWNTMKSIEKDKLCAICNRKVYDLTTISTLEVNSLIDSKNRVCGKINVEQIKNYPYSFKKIGVLFSLSTFFSFSNLIYAKSNIRLTNNEIHAVQDRFQHQIIIENKTDSIIIRGIVTENSIPLPKAKIKLKGTNIQTETDFDGNFKLNIPKEIKKSMIILEFSFVGMNTKEIQVKNLKQKLNIELESEYVIGEVIYKKSLWEKIFG